jgi:hypothetical protein
MAHAGALSSLSPQMITPPWPGRPALAGLRQRRRRRLASAAGLPREEPPRPNDYSTTLRVGGGGSHGDDGATRTVRARVGGVVGILTLG